MPPRKHPADTTAAQRAREAEAARIAAGGARQTYTLSPQAVEDLALLTEVLQPANRTALLEALIADAADRWRGRQILSYGIEGDLDLTGFVAEVHHGERYPSRDAAARAAERHRAEAEAAGMTGLQTVEYVEPLWRSAVHRLRAEARAEGRRNPVATLDDGGYRRRLDLVDANRARATAWVPWDFDPAADTVQLPPPGSYAATLVEPVTVTLHASPEDAAPVYGSVTESLLDVAKRLEAVDATIAW